METPMMTLTKTVITDLVDSDLFTLPLLAKILNVPAEILSDVYLFINKEPSCSILFGLLYLHQKIFPKLYEDVGGCKNILR